MRILHLLLITLLSAGALSAQPVRPDGSDPDAEYVITSLCDMAGCRTGQSFVAKGPRLHRVEFWFFGGRANHPDHTTQTSWFHIVEGIDGNEQCDDFGCTEEVLPGSYRTLNQYHEGRYSLNFWDPLNLTVGDSYFFVVTNSNCSNLGDTERACGGGVGNSRYPLGEYRVPSVLLSTSDVYADGAWDWGGGMDDDAERNLDMRFKVYYAVPEPASTSLLALVLVMLAVCGKVRLRARA